MDDRNADNLIKVIQAPVIEQNLRSLFPGIKEKTDMAMSVVCTAENLESVKKIRAELNKEFQMYEGLRKSIKETVEGPYNHFRAEYKKNIELPFKIADSDLKDKIGTTEDGLKKKCEDGLRTYFSELCSVHHLYWLKFESAGLYIDMASAKSTRQTKLKKQLRDFVDQVSNDVDTIIGMENSEEIFSEYQKSLNLADSISVVSERHRGIECAREELFRRKESASIDREVEKRVEILSAPVQAAEKVLACKLEIRTTRIKFVKLKQFLESEGIEYE